MAEEKKDKEKTVKEAPAAAPAAEPKAAAPEAPAAAPAAPADPLATGTEEAKPAPRRRVKGSKNIPVGVVHILSLIHIYCADFPVSAHLGDSHAGRECGVAAHD